MLFQMFGERWTAITTFCLKFYGRKYGQLLRVTIKTEW
jgi:hypothetical protein